MDWAAYYTTVDEINDGAPQKIETNYRKVEIAIPKQGAKVKQII